jgi:Glycosyltransferase sugar-binding region containing DXD motif
MRGQRVMLYSYDKNFRVPEGVELIDANEILPGDRAREFVYSNGERSPALHSDLFRYEALRRFGGWYFDLDIVLLRDQPPALDIYIASQDDALVNGAVMHFPRNAPLLVAAVKEAQALLSDPEWGAIGPALLTRLVEQHGIAHAVRPHSAAFAICPTETLQLFLPEYRDALARRTADADFVHLWNEIWRRVRIPKDYGPPEGSFLDSLFRLFGIDFPPEARLSAKAVASWFAQSEIRWQRDELLKSTSWRVTAPLRACVNALRRVPGSLGSRYRPSTRSQLNSLDADHQ